MLEDLDARSDELAEPRLGLLWRPVRGVAEVEGRLDPPRDHVARIAAVEICVTVMTSRKTRPSTSTSSGEASSSGPSPSSASAIAFTPSHGRAEWAERPSKTTRALMLPQTAELKRVVGRLEADHERGLVDERRRLEHRGQRVHGRPELLAREEQQPEIEGELRAGRPGRELHHHCETALSCRSRRGRVRHRPRSGRARCRRSGPCRCAPRAARGASRFASRTGATRRRRGRAGARRGP